MEKEFIPYEQALALKELGFENKTLKSYDTSVVLANGKYLLDYWHNVSSVDEVKAPLYQQAFRWFREKYNISSYVDYFENGEYDKIWYFIIKTKDRESQFDGSEKTEYIDEPYYTPEEAELECLKKLIQIVKNK